MKLSELMKGRTLDASYKGQENADDKVLAIDFVGDSAIGDYYVAQPLITEHSSSLDVQTKDSQYMRVGKNTTRTSALPTITLNGDRYIGDTFQDAILNIAFKYGTGNTVVKDIVYFNINSGIGEKYKATISVETDSGGAAGDTSSFSATITANETPTAFDYTEATKTASTGA